MKLSIVPSADDEDIDLTPMIDCVFLLVLFFMVTSSFIEEAKAYKITLPTADAAQTISRDNTDGLSVTVDGAFFFRSGAKEEAVKSLEEVEERLKQRRPEDRTRPVILRVDARCTYLQFVQAKNVLIRSGVEIIFEEVEFSGK